VTQFGAKACEVVRSGPMKVKVELKGLQDEGLRRWCSEEGDGALQLKSFGSGPIEGLDVSNNELTDKGLEYLVRFLKKRRQAVIRLFLYHNKLTELRALCDLIEDSAFGAGAIGGLAELHLSSNNITLDAFGRMLDSLRRRAQACGGFKQPIWMRVEFNSILEDHAKELAEEYCKRHKHFKVCFDGRVKECGCTIKKCRKGADVHLHLFDENRGKSNWK